MTTTKTFSLELNEEKMALVRNGLCMAMSHWTELSQDKGITQDRAEIRKGIADDMWALYVVVDELLTK
jgi:hypothetical protein